MSTPPEITVRFTPEFKRKLKKPAKRYPHIRADVQPVLDRIQTGEIIGAQIPGIDYAIFKVRIRNRDARKGKRGGYRLLYYLKTETTIILITIYAKSDQSDISAEQIRRIVKIFDEP